MLWVIAVVFGLYVLVIAALTWIWATLRCDDSAKDYVHFSVIVAARNEEQTIERVIKSLADQAYPTDKYDVLIIDDGSEDKTEEVVKGLIEARNNFSIVKSSGSGKKSALETGVNHARGEWIVVTDADCSFGKEFLASYSRNIRSSDHFLFGPIRINPGGTFLKLQSMEQSALVGVGASVLESGRPSMGNAANMAIRRSTFDEVEGFKGNKDLPGGDDEFLLRKVFDKYPNGARFLKCSDLVVSTEGFQTLSQFTAQRRRWASKWRRQRLWWMAPAIGLFNLLFLACLSVAASGFYWLFLPVSIKVLADLLLVRPVQRFLSVRTPILIFLLGQILYPFYAIIISILANFGSYEWKGRKYKV